MKTLFLLVLMIGNTILMYAYHPMTRNYSRKDYFSGTQNWDVTQDKNNTLYFANNSGLLVYDSKTWTTIPITNGTNVRSVAFDGASRIYASTFNDFGYFEKGKQGKLEYISITNQATFKSQSSNELFNIHVSGNKVYFQGNKSVYLYENNLLSRIDTDYEIENSSVVNNILFISTPRNGIFMLNGKMFIRIQGSEILENKRVSAFLPYKKGKLLIVTHFHGVFLFDGFQVTRFYTSFDNFLMTNQVFCATTNGTMIVYGTVQRGIAVQNIETGEIEYINTYTGLQNNTVLSAFFDNQDNLWLGLDKGIDYIHLNSPIRSILSNNSIYGSGYVSFKSRDLIYFGTNQGLYYTPYPLVNQVYPHKLTMIKGMEGQIWSLDTIDNKLFCGDDLGGFIINGTQAERIEGLNGTWKFKQLRKWPDKILGCSYQGLFILVKSNNKWKLSHFLKGNFNESSPLFEEDSEGKIWFSHWQKGLFRLHLNATLDSIVRVDAFGTDKGLPTNKNNTLFRVANEIIFSSEYGLYKYDSKTDRMVPYEKWNKLFKATPSYLRLHESPNGDVWCVSGNFFGLARKQNNGSYVIDSLSYRIMQSKILAGFEHFTFLENKRVIVNTEDGFSLIDLNFKTRKNKHFKVYLSDVYATGSNNQTLQISTQNINNTFPEIEKQFNTLRFRFCAPDYQHEGLVQYSYMLENYDKTWSNYSSDNFKEYSKLPKGEYVFKIRARNLLLPESVEYKFKFEILPDWYETNVAYGIYFILLSLILASIVVVINRQSKQGAIEMKKLKEKEIQEQKQAFEIESQAKKREIKELKNQQLQYQLRHKSQELASSTMNLIRKNEILIEIVENINKVTKEIEENKEKKSIISKLLKLEKSINENIGQDNSWKKFQENFDIVYENYLKRLSETYPDLSMCDKKICAYIKMDLSSKDMAPLLNMTVRSIETTRYRIRQKLELDREVNLSEFLQKF